MLGQHLEAGEQVLGPDNDLRALEELSRTIGNESQRAASRRSLNSPVTIQPGNFRDRQGDAVQGKLRDLSNTGCGVTTQSPLMVGDIFLLDLSKASEAIGGVYARCVRCRLINEGSFEQGFVFFSPVRSTDPVAENGSGDALL